jgi:hypothetical protein
MLQRRSKEKKRKKKKSEIILNLVPLAGHVYGRKMQLVHIWIF